MHPLPHEAWSRHFQDCATCFPDGPGELPLLREAVRTLLEHGCYMAGDDIPLDQILTGGGQYLRGLAGPPGGADSDDVPNPHPAQWSWVEAEVRLALARATGLDAHGTLDPRIPAVLGALAQRPWDELEDLFDRAMDQFAHHHGLSTSSR
ncbi:hypothetical protein [Streptomyces niveus]|uniref:hypothetical protein n=1 Tax=Streptomyces niveus TaxID=193462 RepID=UPI0035D893AC